MSDTSSYQRLRSAKDSRPVSWFQESFRSWIAALRVALTGPSSSRSTMLPTDGLPTPPPEEMDIDIHDSGSRNPATSIASLPGKLPNCLINENVDPLPIAQAALIQLQMMDQGLLTEDTLWRDVFAFTGTTRTLNGVHRIQSTWKELVAYHQPYDFKIAPQKGVTVMRPMSTLSWIHVNFSFRTRGTPNTTCTGQMRLIPGEREDWKIWMLVTILQSIDGFGDVDHLEPAKDWECEQPANPVPQISTSDIHNCIIIGAGMSGLCLAGYMRAVGCNAVIIERLDRIGQTWEERYDSVSIHTSRGCGQLPFEPVWGPEYPYHLNVNHLVEGYTKWVKKYNIDIWLSTTLLTSHWDEASSLWTLTIRKHGVVSEVKTRHLVMALGLCSLKKMPTFPNRFAYGGTVLHADDYKRASTWKGLRGVVIGAANSGHDVANDMLEAGLASVTMVQRGATPVLPVEYYSRIYDSVYNDDIPVHVSDNMMVSTPNAITRLMAIRAIGKMMASEPERFDALEKVGFRVVRDMDLYYCLLERFGSHYIDVGVSAKIAAGAIKVKSDALITSFTPTGLAFNDGSVLDADVIIFATGYEGNMRVLATPLLEEEVVAKLHDYWGVDDEGELRGAFRWTGQRNLWFAGGNVMLMRYFAKFLAMGIAADVRGTPLKVLEREY